MTTRRDILERGRGGMCAVGLALRDEFDEKAQAMAAYDATVASYRSTALTALQEVEDNLAALRILEEEAKLQQDAVDAARLSVALTVNQYKAGTVSYLNVVTVQANQLSEERAAVAILNRRLAATVGLVRALGGGWQDRQEP